MKQEDLRLRFSYVSITKSLNTDYKRYKKRSQIYNLYTIFRSCDTRLYRFEMEPANSPRREFAVRKPLRSTVFHLYNTNDKFSPIRKSRINYSYLKMIKKSSLYSRPRALAAENKWKQEHSYVRIYQSNNSQSGLKFHWINIVKYFLTCLFFYKMFKTHKIKHLKLKGWMLRLTNCNVHIWDEIYRLSHLKTNHA